LFSIEQDGRNWVVVAREGATVSVHPKREQAERAVEWLVDHSVVGPEQAVLFGDLTPRELVVLERLRQRGSYTEIARELMVSTNTMKTHVKHVYAKLGVTNRGSALAAATVLGLLDVGNESKDEREGGDVPNARPTVTREAARRYVAAFAYALSTHDFTRYARLLRRDARLITPVRTCEGVEEIIESNQLMLDSVPDVRIEGRHLTVDADGNRAIFECLHSGTLARELPTPYGVIPATGHRFQFAAVHVVSFDECGLVVEIQRYWDLHAVLREQGITDV
jgi:DNA-binding CsgD family transcriptional regulator